MSGGAKGIAKNLSALFSSHVVAVLQQVALTPLFLHTYGRAGYGEWLTLSAAVSYLGTLDFGVQTYVNQDLTVRFHRGEFEEFDRRQSTALRLLLGIIFTVAIVATGVFLLPLEHWLHMDGVHGEPALTHMVVCGAVYLLALQTLSNIPFGYFSGSFMIEGHAYRGAYWSNAKNLCLITFAFIAVWFGAPFSVVAGAQFSAVLVCMVGAIIHLRRSAPRSFPTLKYWVPEAVGQILKPSGYFAMIYSSNFLVYQVPVLVLQRTVGPATVTVFAIMRTIFSMTRNVLNALTQAIGPEVTTLFAKNDWKALHKLYDSSERMIFSVISAVNVGVLFLCPFLLTVWLKKPELFVPSLYLVAAATSCVMSTKEHKFQFQFSTNTHRELARFMFGSYLTLNALWIGLVPRFGLAALMWSWFAIETLQLAYLVNLNRKFFADVDSLEGKYLTRLTVVCVAMLAMAKFMLPKTASLSLGWQVPIAVSIGALILAIDIPLFGLPEVAGPFLVKVKQKFARV